MVSTLTPNCPAGVLAQAVDFVALQKHDEYCCLHKMHTPEEACIGSAQLTALSAPFITPSLMFVTYRAQQCTMKAY